MGTARTSVATDVPVLMRNSERATYRRCRLKWDWSYNQRLEPPRPKGALSFGRLVHAALEAYYPPGIKRGPHPAKTFEQLYEADAKQFSQWDEEGNRIDALELGIAMLTTYVQEYGKDDHIEILLPEMTMQVDVFDRQGNYICTWVGTADAAYRNRSTKRIGLLEHKTAKTIEEDLRVNTGYGEQGLSYWWAADLFFHNEGLLKPDQHLDHVLFNWLRKSLPDDRPVNEAGHRLNKDGTVSKRQPKPLLHRFALEFGPNELASINQRIRAEAWEMAQVRAGKLPVYKNPTKDCSWECQFKEACELHEMGSDYESVLELEFVQWNPYDAHEIAEEKV